MEDNKGKKEKLYRIFSILPAVILALIIIFAAGGSFLWFYLKGFGSRGVNPIQMSFDINGNLLKALHGVYFRNGEAYYLPLSETVSMLDVSEKSHFRGDRVLVKLDDDQYSYCFSNGRLLKNGEELKDCGTAFMLKERTVYVSTLFLEKALQCRVTQGTDEENRVFISRGKFPEGSFDYGWTEMGEKSYIAHALGAIDDKVYTNSLEAFQHNYDLGFRVFEADLEYTSDDEIVLIHSWERANLKDIFGMDVPSDNVETPLSAGEFRSLKIYGKYTTLSLKDLIGLMAENPDTYLVIDGKYSDEERVRKEYADIVELTKEVDKSILDRMIPQIYSESMYDWIMDSYDWKSIIFSWYKYGSAGLEPEPLFDFCEERGIKIAAMKDALENALLDREAGRRGIMIYVYTVNEPADRKRLFGNGVKGIYTDFLYENDGKDS